MKGLEALVETHSMLSPPLSAEDLRQFHNDGYVKLPAAFDPAAALRMQDFIWKYLAEKQGIRREDRSTWAGPQKLNKTTHFRIYDAIGSDRLFSGIDQLLGAGTWNRPKGWGGFLVTFPPLNPPEWTVAYENWHWDGNCFDHLQQLNGLFIFTFLSKVESHGGGTLAVAGSHRLLAKFLKSLPDARKFTHSKLRPKFWASHPWLAALSHRSRVGEDRVARFMGWATDVDGIPARVVELTGEPGDAMLCHPSLLHAVSMNCLAVPRFMRVAAINRKKPDAGNQTADSKANGMNPR
jgi:hypothetical protein